MARKPSAVLEAEPLPGESIPLVEGDIEDGQFTEVPVSKTKPKSPTKKQGAKLMSAKLTKLNDQLVAAKAAVKEQNGALKDLRGDVRTAKAEAKEPLAQVKAAEKALARGIAAKDKALTKVEALNEKIAAEKDALSA